MTAGDAAGAPAGAPAPVRVAVHGAAGRMGRQLLGVIAERADAALVAAIDAPGSAAAGTDASLLAPGLSAGTAVGTDPAALGAAAPDVVVDFSLPDASLALLDALPAGVPLVLGTTGFDAAGLARVEAGAATRPIVFAANYSAGVTVALELLARAARALGDGYDVEILEAHHRHKVDAPSGTALAMGRAVADARGVALDAAAVHARRGITGPRPDGAIGFAVLRAGEIVGEHAALFVGDGERLEIRHAADERAAFARGAIRAAAWLVRAAPGPGLHDMRDVLGLDGAPPGAAPPGASAPGEATIAAPPVPDGPASEA